MAKINPKSIKNIFTEEILNVLPTNANIGRGIGAITRKLDPEWKKNNEAFNQRRAQTTEYKKLRKNIMDEKYADPEYKKWQEERVKATFADPEKKAQMEKAHKDALSTPEYKENFTKAMQKRNETDWAKNVRAARCKPIVLTQYGIYSSATNAGLDLISKGVPNARKKVQHWLKTDPKNCYYITKEEYIMLTGKDL